MNIGLKISVLGCGRWGSFIAWYLNKIGHKVKLWGRHGSPHIEQLVRFRKNEYLEFGEDIEFTDDIIEALKFSDVLVISISSQNLRGFIQDTKKVFDLGEKSFVLCMKGIEESTGSRLSEVIKQCTGNENVAIWVGPGHVQDFSAGIPNCMVIDSYSENLKMLLIENFSSNLIRFYIGNDMIGNEIGAAAKNVMGIAAGVLDGMKYSSLKGALMSRGTREVARLIEAMGGNPFSAYGLAHLGDYQATLFSPYSNNRKFGEAMVTGEPCTKLAEGVKTSGAILELAKKCGVDMPICRAVYDSVNGKKSPKEAISDLFLRKIKCEF